MKPQNLTASFAKAGIWPLNPDVFTQADFLPAEVTNHPDPAEKSTQDPSNMNDPYPRSVLASTPSLMDQHWWISYLPIAPTPESIRLYPKARYASVSRQNCWKGKSRIMTEIPAKVH